jgi:ATP-dependent RNA helicase DDX18/HAS1
MGYRAYLQSYASYQLKKIFDVNALDLNKVAKAFGFKVPPRVNLSIGPGKGQSARVGEKRRREESGEEEEGEGGKNKRGRQRGDGSVRGPMRGRQEKMKRLETLGTRAVKKEKFRKSKEMKALGSNWSR